MKATTCDIRESIKFVPSIDRTVTNKKKKEKKGKKEQKAQREGRDKRNKKKPLVDRDVRLPR